jgi:di/tricarboxylate transporter
MMSVSVACAGAFLTPIAAPANLMVMEPGACKFGDFWKLGVPVLNWFFLVAVFHLPPIWSFQPPLEPRI